MGERARGTGCGRDWRGRAGASLPGAAPLLWQLHFGPLSNPWGEKTACSSNHRVFFRCLSIYSPAWLQGGYLMIAGPQPHPEDPTKLRAVGFRRALQCSLLCLTFPSHSWLHTELYIKFRMEKLRFRGLKMYWCSVWDIIRQSFAFPLSCESWAHREGMDTHPAGCWCF